MTTSGSVHEFPATTPNAFPHGIVVGPDGNLLFTEYLANQIGRITPKGQVTEYPIPTSGAGPWGITTGHDGNLWFSEYDADQIGRITPDGTVTEYPIPSGTSHPAWITAGLDGNVWFSETTGNQIGQITPSGDVTEYLIPTPSASPAGIAPGPDGNLWFTEYTSGKIGRITDAPLPPAMSVQLATGPPGTVVTVAGSGFGSFEPVRITFRDPLSGATVLGMVTSRADGSFSIAETIPQGASHGRATVSALGVVSRLSAKTRFKVT